MNSKKWMAIGWLLVTILPILYFALSMVILSGEMWAQPSGSFEKRFDTLVDYGIIVNGLCFLLTASYVIYLFATPYVPREKRLLWAVVLLLVNITAMPFFWYWYVWAPIKAPNSSKTESGRWRPNTVPVLLGLGIFSIIPILLLYVGYLQGHAYSYVADAFPASDANNYYNIDAGRVSITKQNHATETISLGEALQVSMSDSSIRFTSSGLTRPLYRSFEIPKTAVHSCSKQCGGSTDYILLLNQMDTQIRIENAKPLLDWCWDNHLPILASSQRREWLYNGVKLPQPDTLVRTLRDRAQFDHAAKQACLGY